MPRTTKPSAKRKRSNSTASIDPIVPVVAIKEKLPPPPVPKFGEPGFSFQRAYPEAFRYFRDYPVQLRLPRPCGSKTLLQPDKVRGTLRPQLGRLGDYLVPPDTEHFPASARVEFSMSLGEFSTLIASGRVDPEQFPEQFPNAAVVLNCAPEQCDPLSGCKNCEAARLLCLDEGTGRRQELTEAARALAGRLLMQRDGTIVPDIEDSDPEDDESLCQVFLAPEPDRNECALPSAQDCEYYERGLQPPPKRRKLPLWITESNARSCSFEL